MAKLERAQVVDAVRQATRQAATVDNEDGWRAATQLLIDLVAEAGAALTDGQLAVLINVGGLVLRRATLVGHEQILMEYD